MSKKEYYIVDSDVLPEVFKKVMTVKTLVDSGNAKNISAAIKICNISRSAFYKYKDHVFLAKNNNSESVELEAVLVDRAGVFSTLSNTLFVNGANIVTMNQTAPENGLAHVSLLIDIDSLKVPIDDLVRTLEKLDGIITIRII